MPIRPYGGPLGVKKGPMRVKMGSNHQILEYEPVDLIGFIEKNCVFWGKNYMIFQEKICSRKNSPPLLVHCDTVLINVT